MKSKVILKWTKWFYRALVVLLMILMSIGPWCYYKFVEQGGLVEVIRDYNNTGDFSELQLKLCLLVYAIGFVLLVLSFIKPKKFKFFTCTLAVSILIAIAYVGILVGLPIWREVYVMSNLWIWMTLVTVIILFTTIVGMVCEKKAIIKNKQEINEQDNNVSKSKVWIIYSVAIVVLIVVSVVIANNKRWNIENDTLYIEKEIRIWQENEPLWGDVEFEEIEVKRGVKEVHYMGLEFNEDLEKVDLPKRLEVIGDYAFYGCRNLTEIEIPDSVEYIGYNAFEKCVSLKEINIPEGMRYVFASAFSGCTNLQYVELPSTLEEVDYKAFYNCESLSKIELPYSLERIDSYAFAGCYSLWSVYIPESVTSIGEEAFHENTTLIVNFGSYAEQWAIENGYTYEIY